MAKFLADFYRLLKIPIDFTRKARHLTKMPTIPLFMRVSGGGVFAKHLTTHLTRHLTIWMVRNSA